MQLRSNAVQQHRDVPGCGLTSPHYSSVAHNRRLRPRELSLLSSAQSGEDDLGEFYVRFEKIKDFHRKNQGINARQFINELDELVKGDGMQTLKVDEEDEPVIIDCTWIDS